MPVLALWTLNNDDPLVITPLAKLVSAPMATRSRVVLALLYGYRCSAGKLDPKPAVERLDPADGGFRTVEGVLREGMVGGVEEGVGEGEGAGVPQEGGRGEGGGETWTGEGGAESGPGWLEERADHGRVVGRWKAR